MISIVEPEPESELVSEEGLTAKVEVESLLERKPLIDIMLGKTRRATITTKTTAIIAAAIPPHLLFLGSGID